MTYHKIKILRNFRRMMRDNWSLMKLLTAVMTHYLVIAGLLVPRTIVIVLKNVKMNLVSAMWYAIKIQLQTLLRRWTLA